MFKITLEHVKFKRTMATKIFVQYDKKVNYL